MILSKISIGCFLLRISVKRIHTWIIYAAMFVSTFACTAFFFVTLFQCHPVKYFWQKSLDDGTCINNTVIIALGFVYSIFSIIADFTFALLPAFLVWNLQLKRRTKIALIPLLTMGCVASAAVIARLPFLPKLNSPDFLCKLRFTTVLDGAMADVKRGHHGYRYLVYCRTGSRHHRWQSRNSSSSLRPRHAPIWPLDASHSATPIQLRLANPTRQPTAKQPT